MYQVLLKKSAQKELRKIPTPQLKKIAHVLDKIAYAPRPPGCKKLVSVAGPLWRVRVGDYRIIYTIDQLTKVVEVCRIGHRKAVYN